MKFGGVVVEMGVNGERWGGDIYFVIIACSFNSICNENSFRSRKSVACLSRQQFQGKRRFKIPAPAILFCRSLAALPATKLKLYIIK